MPFGLYDAFDKSWNHIVMIPSMSVVSIMLFGIEEIGTQLEEPFTVLPMQAFCDKIYNWCMEIVSWVPGDNGRDLKDIKPEHAFFVEGPEAEMAAYNGYTVAPPAPAVVAAPEPAVAAAPAPAPAAPQAPAVAGMSFEDFLKQQGQGV